MEGARGPVDVRAGATVVAANGTTVGTVHTAYPHFFVFESTLQSGAGESVPTDYEVPMHAVAAVEGERVLLSVNLEALNELPAERQSAVHRMHEEG
ncbi:MAG: hypothetical protein AVDCRST_MAG19-2265 [uncultured Thermomicrobiales bacterium]|uniref:DUF2171 domain-containing protein n=1 Tax=uncultured Thermomicrobiales bacterium TaxID=1645740 RepID=A0A6J4V1Q9_9BACT|nr:MAG: hypothetical protein AVDCRST_MAG19-2265 [uncultured Thermomicrobiales bacterium]